MTVELVGFTAANKKLDRLIKGAVPMGTKAALGGAMVFETLEKQKCPVGHNSQGAHLRNTIHSVVTGPCTAEVGPNSPHAGYVEFGTGLFTDYPGAQPHRIVPVHGNVLAWPQPDPTFFATSIAGMKPQPFVRPAYAEGRKPALDATNKVMLAELEKEARGV